jgi:glycosyltransferase involved in cell wall biosynthesis
MTAQRDIIQHLGVVIIGRNEGERLKRCLESVRPFSDQVVYVDSGSTDDSVNMAEAMGIEVVQLDMRIPFTAARARNQGVIRLRELWPELRLVQFVDGDCEVAPGWLTAAATFLAERSDVGAVCGRLREKFPEMSVYNMLCDIEWDGETGSISACGGIAMMRVDAFEGAGRFRPDLIAGEEPELCFRMRKNGWAIWRIADDMALHDAAMIHFRQWWKRALRAGFAFAQRAHLHGAAPEREGARESYSAWFWGGCIPVSVFILAFCVESKMLVLFLIYPFQIARLALRGRRTRRENWLHAYFLVLGKVPEVVGQLKFHFHRMAGSSSKLIEHK